MRNQVVFAALTAVVLSVGTAHAGPCNTGGNDKSHPPTAAMNSAAGDKAMSSQDAQRQQQGQPPAAQQAQGAKSTQTADQGC
jgi:hypothetical protein